ncbi:MAG: right-handed parallel beta-helix repeat-containing protein [Candidatus Thermoplasmatota archaeon]|nr:right-handed parallel beta-helix repeat-containing protein [Candidatus Thermoplasmatota archaeon]
MISKLSVGLVSSVLLLSICTSLLLTNTSVATPPPRFYVDDDYDETTPGWQEDHFARIQDAIDAAASGNRIVIYDGIYYEQIIIDKKLDLFGEEKSNTIIDGENSGDVITVNAAQVDISTLTIRKSGNGDENAVIKVNEDDCRIIDNSITSGKHAIYLNNCDDHTIYDNTIQNNDGDGIHLNQSDGNEITYNSITNNENGIFVYDSSGNTIAYNEYIKENDANGIFMNETCMDNDINNNNISENEANGIYLKDHCDYNTVTSNQLYDNEDSGIRIENSSWNVGVEENVISGSTNYGIMVVGSYNSIVENIIKNNGKHGLFLFTDDNNDIADNTIYGNTLDGIRMQNSTNDSIYCNEIYGNTRYGINLNFYTVDNLIRNNYFHDNTNNAIDKSLSGNTWNLQESGTNIVDGPSINGNYWDDFDEPSEGAYDSNDDGIADSAYTIYAANKDNKPLLDVIPPTVGTPQATPETQITGEDVNITVTVTDNLEVRDVVLNITDPTGAGSEFSILQNKTGNVYNCLRDFTTVGDYSYFITGYDARNAKQSSIKTFTIEPATDTVPPTITIKKYGPSFEYLPNSHTFAVTVTDDYGVDDVYIEYWYNGSDTMRVDMESMGGNYYQKVILPQGTPGRVYCVIYANDTSGNQQHTKNPYADANGPYEGFITKEIAFNGTASFDLDGTITSYAWNFGDGTTGTGVTPTHIYSANGTYTVTLTVTDDDKRTDINTTIVVVKPFTSIETSDETLSKVNAEYNLSLTELFYGVDTDGDGTVDAFTDPNDVLHHERFVSISGHPTFLISVDGDLNCLFLWDTEEDSITNVTYQNPEVLDVDHDDDTETVTINVNKSDWIYFDVEDMYPDYDNLTVKTAGGLLLSSDYIWRENDAVYVLDDPDTKYYLIYKIPEPPVTLGNAVFSPTSGSTVNEKGTAITFSYNLAVELLSVELYRVDEETALPLEVFIITSNLTTTDNKSFTYTIPASLSDGKYELLVSVREQNGSKNTDDMAMYYLAFDAEEMAFSLTTLLTLMGLIIGSSIVLYFILRKKGIALESFIYVKNKKLIPFFKPVVFGPLSIHVDDDKVNKAEFYVDGELKDTVTTAPYIWRWDEPAFMKHIIETKVYDENGEASSSGEMTFFVFNPRLGKE